jgi:O-antigen ligase
MRLDRVVKVLLLGLAAHALIALAQVALQGPLGLPGEAVLPATAEGAAIVVFGSTRWLRGSGLTQHPNILGGLLAIGMLLGLPLIGRLRWRAIWVLLLVALLLTFSRSAWLALGLALPPLAFGLTRRQPELRRSLGATLAGAVVAVLIAGVALAAPLRSRLVPASVGTEQRSLSERAIMAAIALRAIGERPLLGVGAGNFPVAMRQAGTPVPPQYVHNVPLLLAAEVGAVSAGLWLWLWLAPIRLLGGRLATVPWAMALLAAWLALGMIGLLDSYPWGLNAGQLLTALLLGLLVRQA